MFDDLLPLTGDASVSPSGATRQCKVSGASSENDGQSIQLGDESLDSVESAVMEGKHPSQERALLVNVTNFQIAVCSEFGSLTGTRTTPVPSCATSPGSGSASFSDRTSDHLSFVYSCRASFSN